MHSFFLDLIVFSFFRFLWVIPFSATITGNHLHNISFEFVCLYGKVIIFRVRFIRIFSGLICDTVSNILSSFFVQGDKFVLSLEPFVLSS